MKLTAVTALFYRKILLIQFILYLFPNTLYLVNVLPYPKINFSY